MRSRRKSRKQPRTKPMRTGVVKFQLSPEEFAWVQGLAKRADLTRADLCRRIILGQLFADPVPRPRFLSGAIQISPKAKAAG